MEDDPAVDITIVDHHPLFRLKKHAIAAMVRSLCEHLQLPSVELCISFVSNDNIQQLNQDYRHKDAPTDVLSFPQVTWVTPLSARHPQEPREINALGRSVKLGPHTVLGDIVIALEVAEANAAAIGQSLEREVAFLLIHGLLHLCGHDHLQPDEEAVMLAEQDYLVAALSVQGAKAPWQGLVHRKQQGKV